MKKLIEWENRTAQHPNGVCEAAAMWWLSRLDNFGIDQALKLKQTDCDELQARLELGTTSWAAGLQPMLGNDSKFSPYADLNFTAKLIAELDTGDFLYVGGGGHASAVYRHRSGVFFFNPGEGFYFSAMNSTAADELFSLISKDSMLGSQTFARKGYLRHHGYKLDRYFGG
jgi:hypothetical protein